MSATGLPRVAMAARKSFMWPRIAGRHLLLQVLLVAVLGILVELHRDVAMDGLAVRPSA